MNNDDEERLSGEGDENIKEALVGSTHWKKKGS
jgi:hypothetical protein